MNTTDLLSKVKLKAALPEGRFEDAEILELAYDALLSDLVPLIVSMRNEYYVKNKTSPSTTSIPISTRALGMALREVKLLRDSEIRDLPLISLEDVNSATVGVPEFFYLENNNIELYPPPATSTDTVKQSFFFRPNRLVTADECATISAIDRATGVISLAPPADWSTSNTYDFILASPGHDVINWDVAASNVTPTDITVAVGDIPSVLAVGDTVALAGESPYAQIPDEAFNLLAQLTVCDCLEEMGSLKELQAAQAKVEKLKTSLASILSNRVQGAPKKFRTTLI